MIVITIVHVCIITNDMMGTLGFFMHTDNLIAVTNLFKEFYAKPVALFVYRYLYQLVHIHMHSINHIYHVDIHSPGGLNLKTVFGQY